MSGKKKSPEDTEKSQDMTVSSLEAASQRIDELEKELKEMRGASVSKELTQSVLIEVSKSVQQMVEQTKAMVEKGSELDLKISELLAQVICGSKAVIKSNFQFDKTKDGWTLLEDVEPRISSVSNLKLLSFLKRGESYVDGEVMKKRAEEEKANFGQKDAEWLLAHQSEIPKEFRKYYLVFPGTVWQDPDGRRCVAYLSWYGGRWCLFFSWLGYGWGSIYRLLSVGKS